MISPPSVSSYEWRILTRADVPKVETGYAGQRWYGSDRGIDNGKYRRGHGHDKTDQHSDNG